MIARRQSHGWGTRDAGAGRPGPGGDDLDLDLLLLSAQASGAASVRDALNIEQGLAAIRARGVGGPEPVPDDVGRPPDPAAGRPPSRSPPLHTPFSQPSRTDPQPRKGLPS